ncbi:MAG TPA: hypothetical protein VFK80_00725, partial [Limnochordia bacterium]|nr:hypothetical protein [Limnochordia bacterium]
FVSHEVANRALTLLQKLYAQDLDVLHLAEQVRARTGVRPPPSKFAGMHFEMNPMITIAPTARGH